jgi:SAM-dependent methyltransferase
MKEKLKSLPLLKYAVIVVRTFRMKYGPISRIKQLFSYLSDYSKYKKLQRNENYTLRTADLFPRIEDKTNTHDIDPVYFIQGSWCARKIFENKPKKHVDIGSQALMVGIISQFTPTVMVDIRPLSISLPNMTFVKGDITNLPFRDGEIESLSSICVIEHIGLGRYGDPLDQFGTEKSASELVRILASGGRLFISVPVDKENKNYFNAHRAFRRDYILSLFKELKLKEELYIYGRETSSSYDPTRFGTGLYYFQK